MASSGFGMVGKPFAQTQLSKLVSETENGEFVARFNMLYVPQWRELNKTYH